ncbi:MAG: hypothetical protein D6743_05060 [Calditrichaeota bacterium]|nr:MAG: hypothetical protein D6743_05060 [Calditrichota bacterium]
MMLYKKPTVILASLAGLLLVSCSSSPTSSDANVGQVKLTVRSSTTGAANAANPQLTKATGLATITSARVVIEKIRFKSSIDDTLDFRFRQPFIKDLALDTTANVIETVDVPFGSYKETEIEIDDLDPEDGQVYLDNPDLQGRSIVVKGYVNNDPNQNFVFTSEFSEEQEREFSPPLVLDENSPSTNVVLFIDMTGWFVDSSGNLLDPRVSENHSAIEDNIKASIDVFEDRDDDGKRDDD